MEDPYLERRKLEFEAYKHLTTLSSGAMVIVSAVMSRTPSPSTGLLLGALGGFFFCIINSTLVMFRLARDSGGSPEGPYPIWDGLHSLFMYFSMGFFWLGVLCLGLLTLKVFH